MRPSLGRRRAVALAFIAFITFMKLRSAVYNVLALARPYRLEHIVQKLDCDIVYLIGTQIRCPANTCHHIQRLPALGFVIHFGYGRSPFTSKCAGCAIFFSKKKFSEKMVQQITTTSDDIRGRGGAVRIKKKNMDLKPIVAYVPPIPAKEGRAAALKSAEMTKKWIQVEVEKSPARTLPMVGADLNTNLGCDKSGQAWSSGTGGFNTSRIGPNGGGWEEWLSLVGYASATTYCKEAGPTFYSWAGNGSTIDHFLVPEDLAKKMVGLIPWSIAGQLQIIPDARPRDHQPSIYTFNYVMKFVCNLVADDSGNCSKPVRWDFEKLASCVQTGE